MFIFHLFGIVVVHSSRKMRRNRNYNKRGPMYFITERTSIVPVLLYYCTNNSRIPITPTCNNEPEVWRDWVSNQTNFVWLINSSSSIRTIKESLLWKINAWAWLLIAVTELYDKVSNLYYGITTTINLPFCI